MTYIRHMVRNERGWNANSGDVKEMLGLGKKPLPDEGMPYQFIQGVQVWVESRNTARILGHFHRVRCLCPVCGEEMSLGRLHQHAKIHKE